MLNNYMELAVDRVMENIIDELELVCDCDRCQMDIKAIALNKLTPHYVVSDVGEVYAKTNQLFVQYEADIITELTSAGNLVGQQPRHVSGSNPA
ncbi:MAG: late competence development ComFB family protein [Peptococcaceae bacterium]|nr:late competence development ComFB family protein [Peptococcaceae bacterium]